ncbi:cytochrome-c peroxidase [Capnocytophaga catalasegens]|uniref:Cytochrome-c peroxidase n=1 Tax=Capnocytophaga catalasegens TaxID=1004260 RepID=A0AAV5AU93_9FLAO|nr:cytochrome-c peroxidase [Capnocytophaga catalasegens]GIZ15351.1 cytochrome-c peroxidase [Capnocytophaga catalasegens]GJM50939.1 cytochrome-c peroxidase [Capnocytophaga catalasegens]GJM52123.1 cytochrome-c peroxidase [Capnocytophaga catalasegens]
MKRSLLIISGLLLVACNNITKKNTSQPDEQVVGTEEKSELRTKAETFFKSVSALPTEEISEQKVALGKKLYFDTRLSKEGNISCNSCHNLETFGVDNLSLSPGDTKELGGRNSPTVFHSSLHAMQFWDGRAKDVEEQAEGPILNPVEHNIPNAEFLEKRLRQVADYQILFKEVYPDQKEPITFKNIANAIGAFERKLNPASRFDDYLDGNENALNQQEKDGLKAFIDNACITCHSGVTLGGQMFQKFGLFGNYWEYTKSEKIDNGLFDITNKESDKYFFKVPALRNVEKTAPYFHDGSVSDLAEVVQIMAKTQLNKELTEKEVQDVVTFLKTLTSDIDEHYKKL